MVPALIRLSRAVIEPYIDVGDKYSARSVRGGRGEDEESLQLHGLCRRDECIDKLYRVKLQRRMQRLQRELEEQTK